MYIGSGNKCYADLLTKPPEIDDLRWLLNQWSASWNDLGAELKVDSNERNKLRKDTALTDDERLEKVLAVWIGSESSDVTWEMVLKVLVTIKKKNVARIVRKYLQQDDVYDKYIKFDDFTPF